VLDRLWWRMNKKPQKPYEVYLAVALPWLVVGAALVASMFILIIGGPVWALGALFGAAIGLGIAAFITDRRRGYFTAIHKHYLERRDEIKKKLGITK